MGCISRLMWACLSHSMFSVASYIDRSAKGYLPWKQYVVHQNISVPPMMVQQPVDRVQQCVRLLEKVYHFWKKFFYRENFHSSLEEYSLYKYLLCCTKQFCVDSTGRGLFKVECKHPALKTTQSSLMKLGPLFVQYTPYKNSQVLNVSGIFQKKIPLSVTDSNL